MADPMQEVMPGLWIGDYNASQDHNLLKERNISCIVSGSECASLLRTV